MATFSRSCISAASVVERIQAFMPTEDCGEEDAEGGWWDIKKCCHIGWEGALKAKARRCSNDEGLQSRRGCG